MLLVSHEASLTGAPRVALDVLRAADGLVDERVALVRWPGPLLEEFGELADRSRLEPGRRLRVALRRFRRTRPVAVRMEEAAAGLVLRGERPDLVYLNTVLSAPYARPALAMGCHVVLHSHEMDDLASGVLARYGLEELYARMRLVACSAAAASRLRHITGVDDVEVIPSAVDIARVQRLAREPLAAVPAGPLVVACGTADPRKGTDLWLDVARRSRNPLAGKGATFLWVGHDQGGRYQRLRDEEGLRNTVKFTGAVTNPYPVMAAADVVTVPSRQDASPLVVFEAMALGKPVVAFEVGGIAEQLGDAGILVPPGDVGAMAEAVANLLADEGARRTFGRQGQQRVGEIFGFDRFRERVRSLLADELAGCHDV